MTPMCWVARVFGHGRGIVHLPVVGRHLQQWQRDALASAIRQDQDWQIRLYQAITSIHPSTGPYVEPRATATIAPTRCIVRAHFDSRSQLTMEVLF